MLLSSSCYHLIMVIVAASIMSALLMSDMVTAQVPTAPPTTINPNNGWLYYNTFYKDATCSGHPEQVDGFRVGVCFTNSTTSWFTLSCNSVSLTALYYNNSDCFGSFYQNDTVPFSVLSQVDDDYYSVACFQPQCTTSSELPLSTAVTYTVNAEYQTYYSQDMCYDSVEFSAILNKQCISDGSSYSSYYEFPIIYSYQTQDCTGTNNSFTQSVGCSVVSQSIAGDSMISNNARSNRLTFQEHTRNRIKRLQPMPGMNTRSLTNVNTLNDDYQINAYGVQAIAYIANPPLPTTMPTLHPSLQSTNAPTPIPVSTLSPTINANNGWLYYNTYQTDVTCSSTPDMVYGSRLGVCFANSSTTWYMLGCNTNYATAEYFDNSACRGSPYLSETIALVDIGQGDDDYSSNACVQAKCSANSGNLPFPENGQYTVNEDYQIYESESMCSNPVSFLGFLNYQCMSQSDASQWYTYPNVAYFNNPTCSGAPFATSTLPIGCHSTASEETSNVMSTHAMKEKILSLSKSSSNQMLAWSKRVLTSTVATTSNDDDGMNINGQAYIMVGNTAAPSLAPTHSITEMPTHPTFAPSTFPTINPNNGWLYYNTFYTDATCSGTPDEVTGSRVGVCNIQNATTWSMMSCDSTSATAHFYTNGACSGTPYQTMTILLTSFSQSDDDSQPTAACFQALCSTDSSALPLPMMKQYTVTEYYDTYFDNMCYNPSNFEAFINFQCLPSGNVNQSIYFDYPGINFYQTGNCNGYYSEQIPAIGCQPYPAPQVQASVSSVTTSTAAFTKKTTPLVSYISRADPSSSKLIHFAQSTFARKLDVTVSTKSADDDDNGVPLWQATSYLSVTNTPAPSQHPTVVPTTAKPFIPPTIAPTINSNSGWIYYNTFYNDASCLSTPDEVYGTRIGTCISNSSTTWYSISCDTTSATVQYYTNGVCVGTPYHTETATLSQLSQIDDDSVTPACFQAQCTANGALPIPATEQYSLYEYYQTYSMNECSNAVSFDAYVNYKCLSDGTAPSQYYRFPTIYTYTTTADCTSVSTVDTPPQGCNAMAPTQVSTIGAHARSTSLMSKSAKTALASSNSKLLQIFELTLKARNLAITTESATTDDDGYHLQAFSYTQLGSSGAPTTSPTAAPTKVPTLVPTTASPTKLTPTFQPTAPPTFSTGWLYYNSYYTDATCSGSPDEVSGIRLGICYAQQGSSNLYYRYSCDSTSATADYYTTSDCSGKPYGSSTIQFSQLNQIDDDDTSVLCMRTQCSSDSSLPLPASVKYSVTEGYETYAGDMCYNPVTFDAFINLKCIPYQTSSSYYDFPQISDYFGSTDCKGTPQVTTPTSGCGTTTVATAAKLTKNRTPQATDNQIVKWIKSTSVRNLQTTTDDDNMPIVAVSYNLVVTPASDSASALADGAVAGIIVASIIVVAAIVFGLIASGVLGRQAMVLGNGMGGGYSSGYNSRDGPANSYKNNQGLEMYNQGTPAVAVPATNPMYNPKYDNY